MDWFAYLRSIGIDPEKFEKEGSESDKEALKRAHKAHVDAMRSGEDSARTATEAITRQHHILDIANSMAFTANANIRGAILSEGIRMATTAKTVDEGRTAIEKVAREMLEKDPQPRVIEPLTQRVQIAGCESELSNREIASAFTDRSDDASAVRTASLAIVKRMHDGDRQVGRSIMAEVAKKGESAKGLLRTIDEQGNLRTMTASSQNVVIQNVSTILLQKSMEEIPNVADKLVTPFPSSVSETTFPEVDAENGVRYVKEGEPIPVMSGTDNEVRAGHRKYAAALAQTREGQLFDNIGRFMVMLSALSRQLRDSRDRLVLARICDSTAEDGKYVNFPGSSDGGTALYSADVDVDGNKNLLENNPLTDYTNIDAATLNLKAKTRRDGTFVMAMPRVLLCSLENEMQAWKIMNSIYCPPASGETANSMQVNPYGPQGMLGKNLPSIIAHPLVATFNGNTADWYIGDPQQQFYERQIWAPEVLAKPAGVDPLRDIIGLWVGSFCSEVVALSKKHFVKCDAVTGS